MISVFIFKSNARGMQFGIGTYINILVSELLKLNNIKIFLVNYYHSQVREFSIKHISQNYKEIFLPGSLIETQSDEKNKSIYAKAVVNLLHRIIEQQDKFIFHFNLFDAYKIADELKKKYSNPIINTVHFAQWQEFFMGNKNKRPNIKNILPSNNIEFTLAAEYKFFLSSDFNVVVTNYMKKYLVEQMNFRKELIAVVPNGISLDSEKLLNIEEKILLKESLGFYNDEKIIVFVGRIDESKGIFSLLKAFHLVVKSNKKARLVIIGDGDFSRFFKSIDNEFGKITFTGFLDKEKLKDFYKIADLGVIPSIYDHCPYSALEMMKYNIPLIVSNIEGLNEILTKESGILIDPIYDEKGNIIINFIAFAEAILHLLSNTKLSKSLAKEAYKILENKFLSSQMAEEMNHIYSDIFYRNSISK